MHSASQVSWFRVMVGEKKSKEEVCTSTNSMVSSDALNACFFTCTSPPLWEAVAVPSAGGAWQHPGRGCQVTVQSLEAPRAC